ncbi:MAG: pilus assembly protein CpaD [Aliidongia sp.]|nr:pilus assembly protein CpaD [Aliidongia sp.]
MRPSMPPLFAALTLGFLTACGDDPASADLSANSVATDNQNYTAQAYRAHRYVYVARGSGNLSEPDRASLATFLAAQAEGRKAVVHVALTGPVAPAELAQLTRILVADGIDPDKIDYNANHPVDGQPPAGRAGMAVIDVATERWKSVLPTCPDHSRLSILDSSNPDDSNFGCTSLSNLSAMVSDPRDLVLGETGGHTDAELTTAAIERLLTDKVKPLKNENSKAN